MRPRLESVQVAPAAPHRLPLVVDHRAGEQAGRRRHRRPSPHTRASSHRRPHDHLLLPASAFRRLACSSLGAHVIATRTAQTLPTQRLTRRSLSCNHKKARSPMLKNVLLFSLPLTIVLAQGGYSSRPSWSWGLPRSSKPTPHSSLNPHCMPTGAPLAKLAESKAAWPTCGTLESLQLCHGTRSTAVERVVKDVCPHTCNACEAVDVTQVARSVGIEIRKPDVRWAGQPPPNCEMLAAVTIPEATLAKLADGGPPAYAKSCFALRHCRADILPRVADFHRPVDDPETIAHIVAHCYLNRESNVSNACCAGSPYPGTGGGSGESLRRPPPPPNPSPPKPPPPTGGAAPFCPRSNRTCIRASPPHPML